MVHQGSPMLCAIAQLPKTKTASIAFWENRFAIAVCVGKFFVLFFFLQNEITAKTREVMQSTMCANVGDIIENEFNQRLAKIPTKMTAKELFDMFIQVTFSIA